MAFNVVERVAELIAEVGRIEKESEGTYLSLGSLFPRLVAEMGKSSDIARRSLEGVSTVVSRRGGDDLSTMAEFASRAGVYFRQVNERDAAFLARINESIDRLSSLDEVIGRVRLDSEEMEIISLNAMTVALKSGNAGKAFSVITDELKRLSGRTIALTEEITARGRGLLDCFASLRDSLGELDAFQENFFSGLDRALSEGYRTLDVEIRNAVSFFAGLIDEASKVREPVQAVMQGIQLQDIIRQSLQHVGISLEEARKSALELDAMGTAADSAALAEELAYVSSIAELSSSLIEEIAAELDRGAASFAENIEAVQRTIAEVEARRTAFIKDSGRSFYCDSGAEGFTNGSARYLELRKSAITTARRLSEQVRSLDESFRGLAGLLSRFQNIVVASRIEVAKNRALAGVATTVQGMIELTERLGEDVGAAMGTTKDFIKIASTAIADYAGGEADAEEGAGEGSEGSRLQATLRRVESDIARLDGARCDVAEAIGRFSLYTADFIALIEDSHAALGKIRELSERLKGARGDLAALKASVDEALGPDSPRGAIRSERFRAMIERFTIFTHKRTAGKIADFEVEEGAGAGEITLF